MLYMDKLKRANELMAKDNLWTLDKIIGSVAKVSFELWDYRMPRNFETVMTKLILQLRERDDFESVASVIFTEKSGDILTDIVFDELMCIKEFREWNLTELEYQKGVDVDAGDAARAEWYGQSDKFFVDLKAFEQNLWCEFRTHLLIWHYFEDETI